MPLRLRGARDPGMECRVLWIVWRWRDIERDRTWVARNIQRALPRECLLIGIPRPERFQTKRFIRHFQSGTKEHSKWVAQRISQTEKEREQRKANCTEVLEWGLRVGKDILA
jgi:hypothetical protein